MACADPSAGPGQTRSAAYEAGGSVPTSARGGQAQGTVYGRCALSKWFPSIGGTTAAPYSGTMLFRFRSFGATVLARSAAL